MSVTTLAVFLCILPASSLRFVNPEGAPGQLPSLPGDIYSFIDSSCKLTVDTKEKKLHLTSNIGNFVISNGNVYGESGQLIGKTTPKPMICESDTGIGEGPSHAFINVASDAPYLDKYLDVFFNKHCWAKANGFKYYLQFGESTSEMKQVYKQKSEGAAHCSEETGDISHYSYPIAMKIILEQKEVSWLVSMDISDAFFNGAHFKDGEKWMKSILHDGLSDVAFAAQYDKSASFVNGALWGIKNTQWSKQWLADVYKNRCGFMNQQAYWNTLLEHFHKEKPDVMAEQSLSSYHTAKEKMPHLVTPMLSEQQQKVYLQYRSDGILREPLRFGEHMMILPNAPPEGAAPGSFVGFRGDHADNDSDGLEDGKPLMCHRSPHLFMGKLAQEGEHKGCSNPCAGGAVCRCELIDDPDLKKAWPGAFDPNIKKTFPDAHKRVGA